MKLTLKITEDYSLIPICEKGIKYVYGKNPGAQLDCVISEPRNVKFHNKAMALVKVVHDALPEPEPIKHKGKMLHPVRTFDNTREYLTILAGHFEIIGLPNGQVRYQAKSWKFAKMTEDEFSAFYSNLVDAALKSLPRTWDSDELERVANQVVNFI